MFQTWGVNNRRWDLVIRRSATALAIVIFLGYISVPIGVLTGAIEVI